MEGPCNQQQSLVELGAEEPLLRQQEQDVLVAVELAVWAVVQLVVQVAAVQVAEVESASLVAVLLVHCSRPVG